MTQRTFTIIKPDSVEKGNSGRIISRLETEGFGILAIRRIHLTTAQAEEFYGVHRERPFFGDLVRYMTSGPVFVVALARDEAVLHLRKIMGATNPKKADPDTIRADFGESIERNAIHGSDSPENAGIEINFFFAGCDLI